MGARCSRRRCAGRDRPRPRPGRASSISRSWSWRSAASSSSSRLFCRRIVATAPTGSAPGAAPAAARDPRRGPPTADREPVMTSSPIRNTTATSHASTARASHSGARRVRAQADGRAADARAGRVNRHDARPPGRDQAIEDARGERVAQDEQVGDPRRGAPRPSRRRPGPGRRRGRRPTASRAARVDETRSPSSSSGDVPGGHGSSPRLAARPGPRPGSRRRRHRAPRAAR